MKQRKQNGEFMKRSRLYRLNMEEKKANEKTYRHNTYLAVIVLALLFAMIFMPVVYNYLNRPILDPLGTSVAPQVVEVRAIETPCDYDAITYIRCRGQELGYKDTDISVFVRIARFESGFNPMAKNPKSTATGIYQFINSTFHRYCKGKNIYNFVDNIDCFYKVLEVDGFPKGLSHWNASRNKWNK